MEYSAVPWDHLIEFITLIGVGPFLLILFSMFLVMNAPSIIDKIMTAGSKRKQLKREDSIARTLFSLTESIEKIAAMMRNVISEKDAFGIISLKMGSVEDFKTRLLVKIKQSIESSGGAINGQIKSDIEAVINSEWHDLKSEFEAFNLPFSMRIFLNKFDKDLWIEDGTFERITNIAIDKDLDLHRRMGAISKQIDIGLRDIQAELALPPGE